MCALCLLGFCVQNVKSFDIFLTKCHTKCTYSHSHLLHFDDTLALPARRLLTHSSFVCLIPLFAQSALPLWAPTRRFSPFISLLLLTVGIISDFSFFSPFLPFRHINKIQLSAECVRRVLLPFYSPTYGEFLFIYHLGGMPR